MPLEEGAAESLSMFPYDSTTRQIDRQHSLGVTATLAQCLLLLMASLGMLGLTMPSNKRQLNEPSSTTGTFAHSTPLTLLTPRPTCALSP